METDPTYHQIALGAAAIWMFLYAGYKTARHDNYWIPGLALAAAIVLSIVRGKGFELFVAYGVIFMLAFLPTVFWPEIKASLFRFKAWTEANPGKDAALTVVVWTTALAAGWLGYWL
jgi:hypothetical protein